MGKFFKEPEKTIKVESDLYVAYIDTYDIDYDVIQKFKDDCEVKFIFFDEKWKDISSDPTINEIHKMKSKYKGNSYIHYPLHIVWNEDKYPIGFHGAGENDSIDGYAVLSKRWLKTFYKDLKYAKKEVVKFHGQFYIESQMNCYNSLLSNDLCYFSVTNKKDSKQIDVAYSRREDLYKRLIRVGLYSDEMRDALMYSNK